MANKIHEIDNGSNYHFHFMIKELANESEGIFECFEEIYRKV